MSNPFDVWKDGSLINHEVVESLDPETIRKLSEILNKIR